MSTSSKFTNPSMHNLISLTKQTQTLLVHFQSSLSPSQLPSTPATALTSGTGSTTTPNPLEIINVAATLLRSHTTTLSLLLLTPPLTPSALIQKIGDVSSGALSNLVAAAGAIPAQGERDGLGNVMRAELRTQVRRLLGTWGEVLALVLRLAEKRKDMAGKIEGPTEGERRDVLAATGVVWEACDLLLKVCQDGVVGLVVNKAEQWRSVLVDAIEELKEWGEDVDEEDEDKAEGSGLDDGGVEDDNDIFGAANKLGKGDEGLKKLLDTSVKRLKMTSMLYQALIKRRLKTFPKAFAPKLASTSGESTATPPDFMRQLDQLMVLLKVIPETVDDLASAFYDLDEEEAQAILDKCCGEAKNAVYLVKQGWYGTDDEFTTWSGKWIVALEAA